MDSSTANAQTCLQGVTRFLKRCVSDVQLLDHGQVFGKAMRESIK